MGPPCSRLMSVTCLHLAPDRRALYLHLARLRSALHRHHLFWIVRKWHMNATVPANGDSLLLLVISLGSC